MSAFTQRLHDVLKTYEIDRIGLGDYPIFDESYRSQLNSKIIRHYRYYEIGSETVELFAHNMAAKMWDIMPYYNKLYLSEKLNYDPLNNYEYSFTQDSVNTNTGTNTSNTTGSNSSNSDSKARSVTSETPQNLLSAKGDYATSAADTGSVSETTSEATENSSAESVMNEESHISREYSGVIAVSKTSLLVEYRAALLNIDLMIISELEPLFMQVWNTNDSYAGGIY